MKLFISYGSPSSRKVQAVVNHLKLAIDVHALDFFAGDLKKSDYLAINPNGMVPALVDGDFKLWESDAIMQYLADSVAETALFPKDRRKRADIIRWQCWQLAHYGKAVGTLAWEKFVKPTFGIGEPDQGLVKAATADFHRFAPILDAQLKGRKFITGDAVTLADFSLGAGAAHIDAAQIPVEKYPSIKAWYRRLDEVPAWVSSAPRQRQNADGAGAGAAVTA